MLRLALAVSIALAIALSALACGSGEGPGPGATTAAAFRDPDGNGILALGPGEPLVPRTELAPAARTGRPLATFVQLTDTQVGDEESPARVAVLDRLGPPLQAAFRPQEALTPQVLAAAVRSINRLRPQAVVATGDLVENAQRGELDQLIAVLRGGRVDPASGAAGYEGVQSSRNPDPIFYRPDVDAPRHPGLLRRAELPFRSPGLNAPWYPLVGNHDLLVQGLVRPTARTNAVATGSRALTELDEDLALPRSEREVTPALVEGALAGGLPGRSERVSPDPRRRQLRPGEALAALRRASGHGGSGPRLDYAFDIGPRVRGIALDIVRRDQGSGGRVSSAQVGWLQRELDRAGRRRVVVFTHQPIASSLGGGRVLATLDRDPRVVAAVSGSTHRNGLRPRRSRTGGYWLVSTSSLVDFPQQARAFRLVETSGGGVALETWTVDHAGRGATLAGISRELSYIDAQGGRPSGAAGGREDRNARLFLR